MVALNPQFTLLAAQFMISLVALSSPATAVAVRSSHSNHSGHLRQRPVIPAPSGSPAKEHGPKFAAKKHTARGYLYDDVFPRLWFGDTKRDSNHVVEARDTPTQADLAGLLGPLLDALGKVTDDVKSLLGGILRRHEPDNAIEHDIGLSRRRHHDHHHAVYGDTINNYGTDNHIHGRSFYADGTPGTAALVDGDGLIMALLELTEERGFRASKDNATTFLLKPAAAGPGSDGKQLFQMVMLGSNPQDTPLCVTFDPNPDKPKEMTAESCSTQATAHASQLFSYDTGSGCLEPMQESSLETGGGSLPTADGSDADGDKLADEEDVRVLARATGTRLKFIPQTGMKDVSSTTSVTTVTVTETATQADSSSTAAAAATPPVPVDATNAVESMPLPATPVPSPMLPSLAGIVEVALPSSTSTSASSESSNVSSTESTDPASVAASIASSSTEDATTTSGTSSYPTPATLLVEITPPAGSGGSSA